MCFFLQTFQLNATDGDDGDFGRVTYSIISGNEEGHFELDERTGCIYVSRPFTTARRLQNFSLHSGNSTADASQDGLLLENQFLMPLFKTFRLYLKASDQGNPPRTATTALTIRVSGESNQALYPRPSTRTVMRSKTVPSQASATHRDQKNARGNSGHQSSNLTSGIQQIHQRYQEDLISIESLVMIVIMVAAVMALLFIVVILSTLCSRKRLLSHRPRRQSVKSEPKTSARKLEFTGGYGENCNASEMRKELYEIPQQHSPLIDSASNYVTITCNTLGGKAGMPDREFIIDSIN